MVINEDLCSSIVIHKIYGESINHTFICYSNYKSFNTEIKNLKRIMRSKPKEKKRQKENSKPHIIIRSRKTFSYCVVRLFMEIRLAAKEDLPKIAEL